MRIAISLAFLVALGCGSPKNQSKAQGQAPPPPAGKTYEEYLAVDAGAPPPSVATAGERPIDSVTLHVIDIGQGAAALVEFPCGAMLIDTGGEKNDQFDSWEALRDYLDRFFQRRRDLRRTIDLLVVTHPHIDHTRNLEAVLERYRVRNVLDNGAREGEIGIEPQDAMHAWVETRRGAVGHRDIYADDIDPPGITGPVIDPIEACDRSPIDPVLTALWGGKRTMEKGDNPNNLSVVIRVDFADASLLLPGDIEKLAIAQLTKKYKRHGKALEADVYLVPHHGSKHSSSEHLIRAVKPRVAVISAGPYYRNEDWTARRFGHPHRDAIGHLLHEEHGVSMRRERPIEAMLGVRGAWKETPSEFEERLIERAIYATAWDGSIQVTATPEGELTVYTGL